MSRAVSRAWATRALVTSALASAAVLLLTLLPSRAAAQGSCTYNGQNGGCTVGDVAPYSITVTIMRAILLSPSTAGIALDAPGGADFDVGFGQTAGPTLTVKSNANWTVSARVTQTIWTALAAPTRADKPAADLQWARVAGGPFTDFSTTGVTVQAGTGATAGTMIPLFLRVKYAWLLDTPGSYSIPVQFTITSP